MKIIARSNRPSSTVDQFIRQSLRATRSRTRFGRGALAVGLALSVGAAGTALADDAAAPSANDVQLLEEIVVTAQFR